MTNPPCPHCHAPGEDQITLEILGNVQWLKCKCRFTHGHYTKDMKDSSYIRKREAMYDGATKRPLKRRRKA